MTRDPVQSWSMLEAVGFSVFPLEENRKKPPESWKIRQTERASVEKISEWINENPNCNIAVATGAISNCFVLDLDDKAAMRDAYARGLPTTVMASTPRGAHLYFAHPGFDVANKAGEASKLPRGMDVRGDGGFVVAPDSYFIPTEKELAAGKVEGPYQWVVPPLDGNDDLVALADAPGWLVTMLKPQPVVVVPLEDRCEPDDPHVSAYGKAALTRICEEMANTKQGEVHNAIYRQAAAVASIVAGEFGLNETSAKDDLWIAIVHAGEPGVRNQASSIKTFNDGWKKGSRSPRPLPISDEARLKQAMATLRH